MQEPFDVREPKVWFTVRLGTLQWPFGPLELVTVVIVCALIWFTY